MNLPPVRFATPEIEEADRAWLTKHREEKRRFALARAFRDRAFEKGCPHREGGTGYDCNHCLIDFFLDGEAAEKLTAIDAEVAAWEPNVIQIGRWWRVPVGAAFAARVLELLPLPDDYRTPTFPAVAPEPPELDLLCCGGVASVGESLMCLSPIVGGKSVPRVRIQLPVVYVLEHGVRCS
jgi:hypothetical protein